MKKGTTLIAFVLCLTAGTILAQNQITYGFVQDPVDQLKMTAVAYPNFTSNNVTISTALFTFYLPAGTVTDPSVPVLPATGNFTNITGTWRIEKITPDLYASFGYDPNDLQGNDVYQCILQNSPSPNTVNGQPVSLFSFRLPGDCTGGSVQVHVNDNAIHMALLNNVGININNQMSVSVNDDPSVDIYAGNNPATDDYDCPLDDVPVAVDDAFSTNEDTPLTANVTGNDSFGADGPSNSAITIVTGALHGTSTVDNNGTPNDPTDDKILYTPNANFNGLDTIIYQICDADNDCDQAIVVITVNAVNDPPSSPNTTATTPEDTPVDICSGISDVDNSSFTTTLLCAPDHGTVSGLTNPSTSQYCLTYTPDAHYSGPDTLCVLVCDGSGACDTSYVYITVTPVNDPPSSPNTTATTPEDTPVNICGNISDVDHNSFTTTLLCTPDHGTVTGLTNPSGAQYCLDYTPDANYNGPDTLCVLVCDGAGACDTSYVYITVTPVNDPPLAVDDNANTAEDTPVSFNITANDTDVDGVIDNASVDLDPNTPGIQTTLVVAGGTFTYTGGGSVTFTPNAGFNGTATAEYRVCDNGTPLPALCDLANINVTVDAVNDPPVANNDNATTPEDSPVSFNITTNDTDSDGMIDNGSVDLDPNTPGIQTTLVVAGGTFTYTGGGSVTFTPNANFNGFASAQYQVCDNGTPLPAQCDTATISVTVNAVNDPPLAVDDNANTAEDTPVSFNITANDTDVDGVIDNASVDLDPNTPGIQTTLVVAGGTFTYTGGGSVTFTPNAGFNGTATAEYRVCDNGTPLPALCDLANINVTVDAVNDPPLANPDYATTPEDSPVSFNLTANDTDTDGMIDNGSVDLDPNTPGIQTSLIVAGGTFNYTGGGSVTFTPNANFNGAVIAQYRVCDNGTPLPAQCDTALITVTVNAVNDPPVANNDNATTNEDTPVSVPVLNNDTDVDGTLNPASVVVTDAPENGTTSVDPLTGAITYTPDTDFVGNDTLVYTVCDNGTPVLCDNATVIITVNATSVRLLAKMQLQGALYGSPDSLMRDNLRSAARIPKKEPYTALNPDFMHVGGGGNEMVTDSATVFANYGSNSIVDWVFIELRSSSNPATVVQTRAALLQRDGDVVDVDGVSPLVFENTNPAMFYVAIRHRNHLGSMTANAIQMTNEGTAIDFRNTATPLWDDGTNLNGFEQVTINGKYALWAGNVNKNKSVVFAGQNNDKDPIFNQIDQAPGNIFQSQSYVYNGYHLGDVNMDAKAIFAGQTNDVDFIFNNVDSHPKNITRSQSYVIRQQLAE